MTLLTSHPDSVETAVGFGLFGTINGREERLYWHPRRLVIEKMIELGHFQAKGYTGLAVREEGPGESDQAKSLQMALEAAPRGRRIKKQRQAEALAREAAQPDTRFVSWSEFKRAVEAAEVWDTDPISLIHCTFPLDLEGEPSLTIERNELGIVTIKF